ncbi:hypothetical protein [Neptuniibacter caesariensis]|uniref:Uncharacterized protein n=1 Tax=Neptuniibacter caesariensis TaxID=207954 RepID=A0A7U8C488_NEPCE|nr:hypothetical protein [Neptuniibacter caesariensis]EAR59629.1 hypothetical protein MED92_00170 [Oceanospirillum sp. MED92] [Neptuniibacter caesariensis]
MNIDYLNRCYAYLLLTGAAFLIGVLIFNIQQPYLVWKNWAHPEYSIQTYPLLFLSYFLDIAAPLVMLLASKQLLKEGALKWYLVLGLGILLFLSKLIGLIYLLIGVVVLIVNRVFHARNT